MHAALVDQAIELLEKANADLEPELLGASDARKLLGAYARVERLGSFGVAVLTRKVDDCAEVATATGTSLGKAKAVVTTGKVLGDSPELSMALQHGDISLDQAAEIASAEQAAPGAARELVAVAKEHSFHVLKEKARKAKLEAEQHKDLGARQHAARAARSHTDELGMVHIDLTLEPHVGGAIAARAEAEGQRLARKAKQAGTPEPFERHLADAYAALLCGSGSGRAKRPELVVLVSHQAIVSTIAPQRHTGEAGMPAQVSGSNEPETEEKGQVAKRGWSDVRDGEVCKIPGLGPVAPEVAKKIAEDAFLSGLFTTEWTYGISSAGRAESRSRLR